MKTVCPRCGCALIVNQVIDGFVYGPANENGSLNLDKQDLIGLSENPEISCSKCDFINDNEFHFDTVKQRIIPAKG